MTGHDIILFIAILVTSLYYLGRIDTDKKDYYKTSGQRCRGYINQIDDLFRATIDGIWVGVVLVIASVIILVVIGLINNFLKWGFIDAVLEVIFSFCVYVLFVNVLFMCLTALIFVGIFKKIINKIRIIVDDENTKYKDNSFIVNVIRKTIIFLTAGIYLFVVVHISFPGIRGLYSISDDFDKGCLETLRQNGNIQAGNKAFVYYGNYYKDTINLKTDNEKAYKPAKMEQRSTEFYSSNKLFGGKLPDVVNVDNMMVGVEEDNIFISDIKHDEYKNIKANWKSVVTDKDGKYDYNKVKKIIMKQYKSSISAVEVAGIVGLMKEKVLIGFDKQNMVFMERDGSDIRFILLYKNEKNIYGPYNVNLYQSVFYVNNKIWFVDATGKVKYCNTSNGELVDVGNYQPVNQLTYYLDKDEEGKEFAWLVVSVNEGEKNYISKFKDSSVKEWKNVGDIGEGNVSSLYASKRGAVAVFENGSNDEVKFDGFKKYGYISQTIMSSFFESIDVARESLDCTKKVLNYIVLPFRKLPYLVK